MKTNIFTKLFRQNGFVKPLAVTTSSAPALTYLLSQSSELFVTQEIDGSDLVAVSTELVKSFQGSLILLVLLISIINIYKPSKIIIFALIFGGMALVASALLETIGMTFLMYGLGLLFNSATLNKTMIRNEELRKKQIENDVDKIIKEASR